MRSLLVGIQALSFVGLAIVLFRGHEPKLAAAQLLLGGVTWLVYS